MEVGKAAKKMGQPHPRNLRKIDPEPLRATPKAVKKPKVAKPYGFEYEHRPLKWKQVGRDTVSDGWGDWEWRKNWGWYETAKQRDQAMSAWLKQHSGGYRKEYYRAARPIDRITD